MADTKALGGARSLDSNDEKHDTHSKGSEAEAQRNLSTSIDTEVIRPHAGVAKVEAFNKVLRQSGTKGKTLLWILGISIGLTMFAYAIDQGTTYIYNTYAASAFAAHSELAAINVASQLVRSISKPFLGKLADITSRPTTYTVVLLFYAIGFAVAASGTSIAAYTVGTCFTAFGKSGLDFLGDVIVADLTNLQWRGFYGSLLSVPFVVTSFIDGFITNHFAKDNWRWGLGMFAIMIPALLIPAIITLYVMEFKAKKEGMVSIGASKYARTGELEKIGYNNYLQLAWQGVIDIDLLGLLLLGFAFGLILLSLSLYPTAKGGFNNSSMIAMVVVGCILLVAFILYEIYIAPKPCCSKEILWNQAFIAAAGIDVSTQLASGVHSLYFPSYIIVSKNWSGYAINTFTNAVTVTLCVVGPIAGLILAKTHRFKGIMLLGCVLKFIGYAIQIDGSRATLNTGALAVSQVLSGMGSFAVVGARVGSQASVSHESLASIIAQLSLWSSIGASIGYAIAGAVWQNYMLKYMIEECPTTPVATLTQLFASIKTVGTYQFDSPVRQCTIAAYTRVNGTLFIAATGIAVVSILFAFIMPDYYLGKQHNVATNKGLAGEEVVDPTPEPTKAQRDSALWRFWDMGASKH